MKIIQYFLFVLVLSFSSGVDEETFSIDYERNTFLMNGQPFRYISGSIHYFRIPHELWHDRLTKARAGGLNAIQFVIPWNLHEPEPGVYNFEGDFDVENFLRTALNQGLYVLLRPGPYICAETNGGGLPYWLYRDNPDIRLRTSDPKFLKAVSNWWNVLLPKIKPFLFQNGGPIIMVQIENEYGSYALQTNNCDRNYLTFLRDSLKAALGNDTVIYSTDGSGSDYLKCGKTDGVYATIDFGMGSNPNETFQIQRQFEPKGPLVNSEYYSGWLDYWGIPHNTADPGLNSKGLDEILALGANVNVYMYHGGTSFGFESGTNTNSFSIEPTSYDYDAPISEAGDLTPKYFAYKEVFSKYQQIPPIQVNKTNPKGHYGKVSVYFVGTLLKPHNSLVKSSVVNSTYPLNFEDMSQENGFLLYTTLINRMFTDPAELTISNLHDRAYVFVNHQPAGILSRANDILSMPLSVFKGNVLEILVENQGRVGYGADAKDFKGILSNVTLGGVNLTNWNIQGIPLDNGFALEAFAQKSLNVFENSPAERLKAKRTLNMSKGRGNIFYGEFIIPSNETAANDTFMSLKDWTKGLVFINGYNIGRYWPVMGPQETLYIPACKLKPPGQVNTIIVVELESPGCFLVDLGGVNKIRCTIDLVDTHQINGPTPGSKMTNIFSRYPRHKFN